LLLARRCRRRNGHAGPGAFALHAALQEKETNAENNRSAHDHTQQTNSTTTTAVSHQILLLKNGNGHEAVMFPPVQPGVCVSLRANPAKMAAGFRFIR
jgi:hypothetical protein